LSGTSTAISKLHHQVNGKSKKDNCKKARFDGKKKRITSSWCGKSGSFKTRRKRKKAAQPCRMRQESNPSHSYGRKTSGHEPAKNRHRGGDKEGGRRKKGWLGGRQKPRWWRGEEPGTPFRLHDRCCLSRKQLKKKTKKKKIKTKKKKEHPVKTPPDLCSTICKKRK